MLKKHSSLTTLLDVNLLFWSMKTGFLLLSFFISTPIFAQVETQGPPPPVVIALTSNATSEKNPVVDFPDIEASFKKGPAAFKEYFSKNLHYPRICLEEQITGRVYVSFIVEKNGQISNVTIERGAHPLLDTEAKRMIENMPKWNPGKHKGKKVRTRCRMPINFTKS